MTLKKITDSVKNLAENIVETVKESKIIDKITSTAESFYEQGFSSNEKSYSNVEYTPYNKISLDLTKIEDKITDIVKKEKSSETMLTLKSFEVFESEVISLFHNEYINSFKFFYSDGTEIKKGDLVYSGKEKTFIVFDLTLDNIDNYLYLLGEGKVLKSNKSLAEVEKFIKS